MDNDTVAKAPSPPPPTQPETLLYFAFGSNLSSTQMRARCPGAAAVGLAFLPGYDFIINERGYANVIPSSSSSSSSKTRTTAASSSSSSSSSSSQDGGGEDATNSGGVYGLLYRLASAEEKRLLDGYEGVPWAYEDLVLDVELLVAPPKGDEGASQQQQQQPQQQKQQQQKQQQRALVYVDRQRVSPAAPRDEYVARMNRAIDEAAGEWGLPGGYVRDVMRRYIPAASAAADASAGGDER